MRWEYQTFKIQPKGLMGGKTDLDDLRNSLNQAGAQGWELVSSFETNLGHGRTREVVFVFKRPAPGG
jgi:hypothetical protein